MDSSSVKVKKEIKEESIESFDFPIKNETKSDVKLKVKKERKDNLGLQIGLDIIDRLEIPVKNEVQEDFDPDIEFIKEVPASQCFVQGDEEQNNSDEEGIVIDEYDDFDEIQKKSGAQNNEFPNKNQKTFAKPDAYQEDVTKIGSAAPKSDSSDDIITDKYYCALCNVSCGYSKPPRMNWEWDTHLNSREHKMKMTKKANKEKEKADKEKKKSKAKEKSKTKKNEFPKGTTLFMKGFKNGTTREDIKNALLRTFGVENKALASVEIGNNGSKFQSCGYVIFCKENAANELLAKIKGRSKRFKIKGAGIKCKVVEGQEENTWHEHLARKK